MMLFDEKTEYFVLFELLFYKVLNSHCLLSDETQQVSTWALYPSNKY